MKTSAPYQTQLKPLHYLISCFTFKENETFFNKQIKAWLFSISQRSEVLSAVNCPENFVTSKDFIETREKICINSEEYKAFNVSFKKENRKNTGKLFLN